MASLVTQETNRSVHNMITSICHPQKEADAHEILKLFKEVTAWEPKVWGNEKVPDFLIGYGKYNYTRKGGKEVFEWFRCGFAPRKSKITIYLTFDINEEQELLNQLGKCKWGRGCLYINKLGDVDKGILKKLIAKCVIKED